MHNDTPLGTTMHLKALDRQAVAMHRPRRPRMRRNSPVASVAGAIAAFLRFARSRVAHGGMAERRRRAAPGAA